MTLRRIFIETMAAAGVLCIVSPFYGWLFWEALTK